MDNKAKIVFEPQTARKLLKEGCQIIDIKPHKEDKNRTVFVFVNDDNFKKQIAAIIEEKKQTATAKCD